jgi:predicted RNA binding protein YcfA (HicA-like mRNA interferase family)
MKRRGFLRHLQAQGCVFLREGGRHSVYLNPASRMISTVPRHSELDAYLCRKICRDLGVAEPPAGR